MTIFCEWFIPGESDLLLIGICIALIACCLPWRGDNRSNACFLAICLAIYTVCELVPERNYLASLLALLIGGFALSVFIGRGIRWLLRLSQKR